MRCIKDFIHLSLNKDIEDNQTVVRELEIDPIRVEELEQNIIPNPNGTETKIVESEEFPYHIILDIGHHLHTTNRSVTHNGKVLKEYDINWKVGEELIKLFNSNNIEFSLTLDKDVKIHAPTFLNGRVKEANRITRESTKPTLFLSLHHDGFTGKEKGSTMFIHSKHSLASYKLAQALSNHIPKALTTRNRGVKIDNYTVLTCLCPAVLIEFEFYDNPYHFYWVQEPYYHKLAAQSVVDSLIQFASVD